MRPSVGCLCLLTCIIVATLALCPPRVAAAQYCNLGPSGQSCAEFPIVTHWVNADGGGFDLAGTDADPLRLTPPSYGTYSAMTTDTFAPTDQDVLNFINTVEANTGCPAASGCVPMLLWSYDSDAALGKLVPGLNKLQVIHNVWVPVAPPRLKTLFTFIFPPGWQPTNRYPILLSGNGGSTPNNAMFFLQEQTWAIATYVAQSTQGGRTGLIAALSNAGGREAQGWHQGALDDVARMLDFMQAYGVDPLKVVNFGGSRGGGTALLWGENPDQRPEYSSIGVFALAPPSHGGFISQQGLASYQFLHGVAIDLFNDPNGDRYAHVPRLIDVNPAPTLKVLLDQDNPGFADRPQEDFADPWRKSPSGYLSFLAGKPVVLSVGAHDAIIPLPMVLKLDRTLRDRWGIPRLTCLTLRTGHNADEDDCPRAELHRFLDARLTGQPYTVPDLRRYFKATDLTNHPLGTAVALPNQITLPFSATVPYRLATSIGQWATLAACGQTGKTYSATLTDAGGAVVFSVGVASPKRVSKKTKVFGQNTTSDFDFDGLGELDPECDVIRLDRPGGWGTLPQGTYRWSFTFDGRAIDPGNLSYVGSTGWGRPTVATTIVDGTQPPRDLASFDPQATITMGVDEF